MQDPHARVHFLDLLRGCAVIVMVLGHSVDAVLTTGVRSTELFRFYDSLRGFTAPMFLTISGFAFSVATLKRWDEYRRWSAPLRARLIRAGLLLLLGYTLHVPFFSFTKLLHGTTAAGYAQLFQVDVLQCMAVTLTALHLLVFLIPSPAAFGRYVLVLATAIVLATPFVWSVDCGSFLSPQLSPYLNTQQASIFPLFPYAAYLLVGTVTGLHFVQARAVGGEERLFGRVMLGAIAGIVASIALDRLGLDPYPPHDFWKTSPYLFLLRTGVILSVMSLLFSLRTVPSSVAAAMGALGQGSLLVYVTHLVLVYGSSMNDGLLQRIGQTLPAPAAAAVALGVLALMILLVRVWRYLRRAYALPSRLVQAGLASTLLYLFFTNPY
jgi:surface polysaccharide O-acyltransferase-like enzyme